MSFSLVQKFLSSCRGLTFGDGGGISWSFNPNTNTISANGSGAGASGGNPTAKVGLSAVNGSASTFLRSDGAPQLDQAIAPTWTGAHAFAPAASVVPITVTIGAHALSAITLASLSFAWGASQQVGLDIGNAGAVRADTGTTVGLTSNMYYNGTNWVYKTSAAAGEYNIAGGVHTWTTAASGTAGNNATPTTKMSLSLAGVLTVASGLGINGVAAPAQVTGFGTPTGNSVVANFSGTAATTAQMQATIAEILTILKSYGMIGA